MSYILRYVYIIESYMCHMYALYMNIYSISLEPKTSNDFMTIAVLLSFILVVLCLSLKTGDREHMGRKSLVSPRPTSSAILHSCRLRMVHR